MQPLTKALRRRLRRLDPKLSEQDIDRFERERRAAMQATLLEDPLYAAALGPGPESRGPESMVAAPPSDAAESARVVRRLGSLLQRAAEVERQSLDRKADRALARQEKAARPKRPLAPGTAAKTAKRKAKPVAKKPARKPARKAGGKKAPLSSRTGRRPGR